MLAGWAPSEVTTYYDADGEQILFRSVTVHEPEFDQADVEALLQYLLFEEERCGDCGWHPSLFTDPTLTFMPAEHTCPACRLRIRHERRLRVSEDRAMEGQPDDAPRKSDGRSTFVRLLGREEAAQIRAEAEAAAAAGEPLPPPPEWR